MQAYTLNKQFKKIYKNIDNNVCLTGGNLLFRLLYQVIFKLIFKLEYIIELFKILKTCTPQKVGQDAAPWLRDFLKIDIFITAENALRVPMICQKIMAFNGKIKKSSINPE